MKFAGRADRASCTSRSMVFQGLAVGVVPRGAQVYGRPTVSASPKCEPIRLHFFRCATVRHAAGNGGMRLEARYVHHSFMKSIARHRGVRPGGLQQ